MATPNCSGPSSAADSQPDAAGATAQTDAFYKLARELPDDPRNSECLQNRNALRDAQHLIEGLHFTADSIEGDVDLLLDDLGVEINEGGKP